MKEGGRNCRGTITLWGLRGVQVLNGMHTQLGIISITLFIDLVGTRSKSSNNIHNGNFPLHITSFHPELFVSLLPPLTQSIRLILVP